MLLVTAEMCYLIGTVETRLKISKSAKPWLNYSLVVMQYQQDNTGTYCCFANNRRQLSGVELCLGF